MRDYAGSMGTLSGAVPKVPVVQGSNGVPPGRAMNIRRSPEVMRGPLVALVSTADRAHLR